MFNLRLYIIAPTSCRQEAPLMLWQPSNAHFTDRTVFWQDGTPTNIFKIYCVEIPRLRKLSLRITKVAEKLLCRLASVHARHRDWQIENRVDEQKDCWWHRTAPYVK